ncbi:sigma-70 family RNA polymerase sigma factor [Mycolicibacterium goodii]|uniref:sigma-70 family RNA polymerase sigma factor n=1 Tax=Mycolicibacterium goodii TaxID=134601 RepID=UPI00093A91AD|nr:sigma-70 family RNA polymerase sigma factor [Mycolicibacterium goodii]MBU8810088.1 sigma-70 family RNA polymerase sigma factor [Mycolicibacterium goodii]OKH64539.1 RNA polymerase sigma 70 [Mycobacterium sp. SWH-M5]
MTLAPDPASDSESEAERAARFTRDAMPYRPALLRTARRLARTEADAEDLVQDALLNAYVGFRRFRPGTNMRAWLFRIMHNRWISTYRMTQRRPTTFCVDELTDSDIAEGALYTATGWRSAEDEALDAIPDAHLRTALGTLPEGFRTVLFYADIEGFTYAETAVLMGIPVGTVMSRIARGRQRLRAALTVDTTNTTNTSGAAPARGECAA